jgi:hypothetical protein
MAPAIEAVDKVKVASAPVKAPVLNEKTLSSMTRRPGSAHSWHDLEIGISHLMLASNQFLCFPLMKTYNFDCFVQGLMHQLYSTA